MQTILSKNIPLNMTTMTELYREVGTALHKAQLAEYNIVSALILLGRTGSVSSARETQEEYWSKKTLGQLLKPMIESGLLSEDAKLFIQTFVNARNHLAHSFFISSSGIHLPEERNGLLMEVTAIQNVFDRAIQLFDQVLANLAYPLGIEMAKIKADARAIILGLGLDGCEG